MLLRNVRYSLDAETVKTFFYFSPTALTASTAQLVAASAVAECAKQWVQEMGAKPDFVIGNYRLDAAAPQQYIQSCALVWSRIQPQCLLDVANRFILEHGLGLRIMTDFAVTATWWRASWVMHFSYLKPTLHMPLKRYLCRGLVTPDAPLLLRIPGFQVNLNQEFTLHCQIWYPGYSLDIPAWAMNIFIHQPWEVRDPFLIRHWEMVRDSW